MNRLLQRQLKRLGLSAEMAPSAEEWQRLLNRVSRSYDDTDQERYLLERSLTISSQEMRQLYESLRQASEQRVAAEHQKLGAVMDSISDGLCVLDCHGQLLFLNPAADDYLQLKTHSVVKRSLLEHFIIHDPEDHQHRLCGEELLSMLARGVALHDENALLKRPGEESLPIACTFSPLRVDGELLGQVFLFRDISEHKLFEARLRQAQWDAEQASRSKSDFLATMSHEIRTPINGVLGMAGLLLETGLNGEQRDYVDSLHRSAEALLAIINDILDFSKIEAGKLELERLEFDPQLVVEEVLDLFAERVTEKGLELTTYIDANVPGTLFGDASRLRQVITNLVANAIKFTHRGGVEIRLLRQGAQLRFEVRDSGIGIGQEVLQRLFSAFSQADSSTTRQYGGTGLGLSISKRLVQLMGGSIGVKSDPGQGSLFWFVLPLPALMASVEQSPKLSELSLLLLDHSTSGPSPLCEQLRSWQVDLVRVEALEELFTALQPDLLQSNGFDGVVINGSGEQVLQAALSLKRHPQAADLPQLLLLPLNVPLYPELLEHGPAPLLLRKPLKTSSLFQRLMSFTERLPLISAESVTSLSTLPHRIGPFFYGRRVLVVEDNQINQQIACRMLEKMGVVVDVAENGLEALQQIESRFYDLVLMDCQMPEMDGYEATRRIRQREHEQPQRRHLAIIGITANALAGDRERCLDVGMDDYLPKPIRLDELRRALQAWLKLVDSDSA